MTVHYRDFSLVISIAVSAAILLGTMERASAQVEAGSSASELDVESVPAPGEAGDLNGRYPGAPASEAPSDAGETATAPPRRPDLIGNLAVFVLAVFVGFEVITKVPPTLHTPLMSGSNAISGITLVGALTIAGTGVWGWEPIVGFFAVILATINVVGGFWVTHRMLSMFRKR